MRNENPKRFSRILFVENNMKSRFETWCNFFERGCRGETLEVYSTHFHHKKYTSIYDRGDALGGLEQLRPGGSRRAIHA